MEFNPNQRKSGHRHFNSTPSTNGLELNSSFWGRKALIAVGPQSSSLLFNSTFAVTCAPTSNGMEFNQEQNRHKEGSYFFHKKEKEGK